MKYNHMPLQTNTTRSCLPIYSLLIGQGVMNTIFLYNVYTIILHDNINDTMLSSLSCIYQTHELLYILQIANKLTLVVNHDSYCRFQTVEKDNTVYNAQENSIS